MIYEGTFAPPPGRFALVAAHFNEFVVQQLVAGAEDALARHGVAAEAVDLVRVPGSFEIPPVAQRLAKSGRYAAIICLGAVIKGDTDHYDHVAAAAATGVAQAALTTGVPVIFGILTCDTLEQAINRAGTRQATTLLNLRQLRGIDLGTAASEGEKRTRKHQKNCHNDADDYDPLAPLLLAITVAVHIRLLKSLVRVW